ncbi:MAG: hypothetical protein Q8Q02_08755 [Nocardioides sp.]|nr:hypothetical protein [Nocardioides sp.]
MDRPLTDLPVWVVWTAGGAVAVLALAVVALAWSALRTARALRRTTAAQADAVTEIQHLRAALAAQPVPPESTAPAPTTPSPTTPSRTEYLITSVLTDTERSALALPARADAAAGAADLPTRVVDARQFTTMAVGESLVRLFTVGHGVRRALSAESRNRAGFAMRREVRRSRKHRRQELREARRYLHAEQRARLDADRLTRRPGDDAA